MPPEEPDVPVGEAEPARVAAGEAAGEPAVSVAEPEDPPEPVPLPESESSPLQAARSMPAARPAATRRMKRLYMFLFLPGGVDCSARAAGEIVARPA
jgi:hypothetical protein